MSTDIRKRSRPFTFMSRRTVALRISYDGKNYHGMALQRGKSTIGGCLVSALEATGLGDKFVCAGRTDAGVGSICMIVSTVVISRLKEPNRSYEVADDDYREYRYDFILNSCLPKDIRVTGWAPVPDTFNARFSCIQRQYRYYFHKSNLNFLKIKEAALKIKEMKNFYFLSKHSDKNARYERTLDECRVVDDGNMYYLDIKAKAFLHNMIRKIIWVIKRAGEKDVFSLDNIGTAEPYSLVFCGAVYQNKLEFISNHHTKKLFQIQLEAEQIKCKILKLKLECFDKEITSDAWFSNHHDFS